MFSARLANIKYIHPESNTLTFLISFGFGAGYSQIKRIIYDKDRDLLAFIDTHDCKFTLNNVKLEDIEDALLDFTELKIEYQTIPDKIYGKYTLN